MHWEGIIQVSYHFAIINYLLVCINIQVKMQSQDSKHLLFKLLIEFLIHLLVVYPPLVNFIVTIILGGSCL